MSGDGSVVVGVGSNASGYEAFRWTETDGMVGLGYLPGAEEQSRAFGVSADGSVIVGGSYAEGDHVAQPFIWDAVNGMRDLREILEVQVGLDLSGWTIHSAKNVSADGLTMVGNGTNPNGDSEAWVARIPEPTSSLFLVVGTVAILRWGRGRMPQ